MGRGTGNERISRKPDAPRKKVRIGIFLQEMNSFSYAKEVYVERINFNNHKKPAWELWWYVV